MDNSRSPFMTGEIVAKHAWTERLFSLKVQAEQICFKAGQFIRLQLPIDGVAVAKPYSLLNSPEEPVIEVYFNTVENGQLSTALAALETGDTIDVSQSANGFFVLDELPASTHLWMIATGTGIGPYISILRTAEVWKRFEKIVLVHAVPFTKELVFLELLITWLQDHPEQFKFVSCVTREENPSGLQGRVTDLFANGALEKQTGIAISKDTSHVMLCGNQNMINDMKRLLAERAMSRHLRHKPGHITTEQYF